MSDPSAAPHHHHHHHSTGTPARARDGVHGPPGHGHDFAAANKAYFDEHADRLEEMHPGWREMARKEAEAIQGAWPELFDRERTAVLDYACGIGFVSEQLSKHVKSIVGADISQNSVGRYNALAATLGLAPEQMKAVCVELKGEPGELDGAQFDVVVCCASYHHFASIDDTTRLLAGLLKAGGSLIVVDIKAEADGRELVPEKHHGLVPHTHGISEAQLRATFEGAGLGEFEMKEGGRENLRQLGGNHDGEVQWFVARGVKPVESKAVSVAEE